MGKIPSPIPGAVYRHVEHKLRHRDQDLRRALQILADTEAWAGSVCAPQIGGAGGSSGPGDRTASAAIRLGDARDQVKRAKGWVRVFRSTFEAFRGTDAGKAVLLMFEKSCSQAETARRLGCDRQTVRRYKDDFIIRAAFLAVQVGLIRFREDGEIHDQG